MSNRSPRRSIAALVLALALVPLPAGASGVADWNGHLSFGFAKLFRSGAPNGSLSLGAGLDHALVEGWRLGPALGYHLLGSTSVLRGSVTAGVDYSVFDAELLLSRDVAGPGGLLRVAAGPGLMSCQAVLSTAGGGAAFSDLAVSRSAGALAVDVTWMSSRPRPVRVGLETGARIGFLPRDTWTVWDTRLAIHY